MALPQADPQFLVAAAKLVGQPGVNRRQNCRSARYDHLLLSGHELIEANATWTESLLVTPYSIAALRLPQSLQGKSRAPARKILPKLPIAMASRGMWFKPGAAVISVLSRINSD
ncbi:MAG: Hint domain-containing protein [Pseudomonadota bacterium]